MQKMSSNSFNILWSKQCHLWQWSFEIVLFSEYNVCTWPSRIRKRCWSKQCHLGQWSFDIVLFSENNVCTWPSRIRKRYLGELFTDCHRQTPKPVVWTHSLAIMPQPKGAIFSHRKRWMVSMELKHHTIIWKHRFQHLKAFFDHFMQFCGPWITHKIWHSNAFRSNFKMTKKTLLVTFSIIFFLPFHLAIGHQSCPKNLG